MKKLLYVVLALAALLAASVFVLPNAIDWRPRIAAAVKSATGRDLRIDGKLSIALLPTLRVSAADIHLANAPGAAEPDMASIGSIALQAELLPLLSGRLVIDSLTVAKPVVHLSVDKQGRPNWIFPAKDGKPSTAGSGLSAGSHPIELRAARLDQGLFTYTDAITGQQITTTDITLTGGRAGGSGRLDWKLGFTMNKEPVAGEFTIDSLDKLAAGQPAAITMRLKGKHLTSSYQGTAEQSPAPGLNGTFDLDIPSVGALFAWLQQPLAYDPGPLNLHLETVSSGGKLTLRRAALTGRAILLTAQAEIDATKSPPSFEARIDIPKADIDAYTPPAAPPSATPAPAAPAARAETGWSTAPYDFAVLGGANGHLAITLGSLRYRGLDITKGLFDFTLGKKILRLTKSDVQLAGGSITTLFTLDASAPVAKLDFKTKTLGLQARPLLRAFAGTDRLSGAIAYDTALTATGRTQQEMIASLAGTGNLRVTNGAIHGINLAQSLRRMGSPGAGNAANDKTDFSELGGTYSIKQGILSNPDLLMLADGLRLSGSGTVALPPRSLSYTLQASLRGQGIGEALAGVPIPIRLDGPWAAPNIGVDWNGVLSLDPSKLKNLPGDIGKLAPDVQKLLPGLKLPGGLFGK